MVKDFKAAYKTIRDDQFTPGLEEVICLLTRPTMLW